MKRFGPIKRTPDLIAPILILFIAVVGFTPVDGWGFIAYFSQLALCPSGLERTLTVNSS